MRPSQTQEKEAKQKMMEKAEEIRRQKIQAEKYGGSKSSSSHYSSGFSTSGGISSSSYTSSSNYNDTPSLYNDTPAPSYTPRFSFYSHKHDLCVGRDLIVALICLVWLQTYLSQVEQ